MDQNADTTDRFQPRFDAAGLVTAIVTDAETLQAVAQKYRERGWPAEVKDGAFTAPFNAQSAGPPPWHLYRVDCQVAHVVSVEEPYCATLWRFSV